jgi:predicted phosphodiesterase
MCELTYNVSFAEISMIFTVAVVSDIHAYTNTPAGSSAPSHLKANDVTKPAAQHPLLALHALIGEQTINADYLICPGDLCDKADTQAAQYAWTELEKLASMLQVRRFFGVTGNHDLDSRYLAQSTIDPKDALRAMQPPYPIPGSGNDSANTSYWLDHFAFLTDTNVRTLLLNTCGTHGLQKDEMRHGRIGVPTLQRIRKYLQNDSGEYAINLAICHHHPQQHSELELGEYDFMRDGQQFLQLIGSGEFGSWIVIHGHKHHPKITYAAGGNTSPVVFSAGSFSVLLDPQHGSQQNTFHLLEIEADVVGSTLRGQARTFEFDFGRGWRPAHDGSAVPYHAGFGFRGDLQQLAASIAAAIPDSHKTISELASQLPDLQYLIPSDRAYLFDTLRKRHGMGSAFDKHRKETLLYKENHG